MMFFLKGLLVGLIFGIPAGPVGALCVQRSLQYGMKSGMITGLGSSAADCFYAAVGAFGISAVSDFLQEHTTAVKLAGGILVLGLGISILLKKHNDDVLVERKIGYPAMFMSSLGLGIANPAAVITIMFGFSYLGINCGKSILKGSILVFGVLIGTLIWWLTLSSVSGVIKSKFGSEGFNKMNKVLGSIMIGFSVVIFGDLIVKAF